MKFLTIIITILSMLIGGQQLSESISIAPEPTAKEVAYSILTLKCNVCHQTQNPSKVFTKENMDRFAKKIKRQVFLWRRMPKGDEIKLTKEEKQQLKSWIKSL